MLSQQRLLFSSLASSAFLIYLDPQHVTNQVKTLVLAQAIAAVVGWIIYSFTGPGFFAGEIARVIAIFLMILLDVVHPPTVSTSLSFALRTGDASCYSDPQPIKALPILGFAYSLKSTSDAVYAFNRSNNSA